MICITIYQQHEMQTAYSTETYYMMHVCNMSVYISKYHKLCTSIYATSYQISQCIRILPSLRYLCVLASKHLVKGCQLITHLLSAMLLPNLLHRWRGTVISDRLSATPTINSGHPELAVTEVNNYTSRIQTIMS